MVSSLTRALGWFGLLPFIIACFYTFNEQSLLGYYAPFVFVSYSAVILGFLAGTLWGSAQRSEAQPTIKRLILLSNVFALLGFVGLLLSHVYLPLAVALLGGSFWLLWRVENATSAHGLVGPSYRRMRQLLSYSVVGLHIALLVIIVF